MKEKKWNWLWFYKSPVDRDPVCGYTGLLIMIAFFVVELKMMVRKNSNVLKDYRVLVGTMDTGRMRRPPRKG